MDLKQFVKQTNKFLEDVCDFGEIIQYMYKTLLPLGIRFKYESLNGIENRELTRVVLVAKESSKHFNTAIVNECSGSILGFYNHEGWKCKLITRPPNCFYTKYKHVNAADYDVFAAEDGTTITLYWLEDRWILSTKNGYDVGNLEWRGAKYSDVFMEALKNTAPEFDLDQLNKSASYTIGFCHPTHHPFRKESLVWFIYGYNIDTGEVLKSPGLPEQLKIECDDYTELIYNSEAAYKEYVHKNNINFGYVLRYKYPHKNIRNRYKPDIFIESSLMSNIRRILYQQKFIKDEKTRRVVKRQFSHIEYVIWRAYLDISKRKMLITLFPQYNSTLENFDNIIDAAVNNIVEWKPVTPLEESLREYISNKLKLYKKTSLSKDVIKDIITSPNVIDIYIKHMYDWS